MADLAVIALGLDASGMKTGADQANRALTDTEKKMDALQKRLDELQKKLNDSGKGAEEASKGFKNLGGSAQGAGASLAGLGGPVGQVAGAFQNLQGQLEGLTEDFGVIGGAAVGAIAGVVALGAAFVKLTLDGVKLSDEIGDIAEETGLSVDVIQRFASGASLMGEEIGGLARSFRTYQGLVQEALIDKSGEAAHKLFDLKVSAKEANKDIGTSFINVTLNVKALRETLAGTVATNELYGRQIGAIVRGHDGLATALRGNRPALEEGFILPSEKATQKGQELDTIINKLSTTWKTFKQTLAEGQTGQVVYAFLDGFNERLKQSHSLLVAMAVTAGQVFIGRLGAGGPTAGQPVPDPLIRLDPATRAAFKTGTLPGPLTPPPPKPVTGSRGETEAEKEAKRIAAEIKKQEELNAAGRKKSADRLIEDMENLNEAMRKVIVEAIRLATELPVVKETTADIFHRLGLPTFAGGAAPPITGGAIPGVPDVGILRPDQIQSAREARIHDALGGIFEDFVFQITTARTTVGGAFKGLLLGITDTFAAEFALQVQKSLQEAFIRPLASWLESALGEIFGGLSIKGLAKGLGALASLFVGFFADGGTIPSGHWGVAGERGPEIVYAGSQPMHVTPMGGSGGMSVVMNFSISTATGEVTARTQDQIADAASRGLERAQRLRGAR